MLPVFHKHLRRSGEEIITLKQIVLFASEVHMFGRMAFDDSENAFFRDSELQVLAI